MFSSIWDLYSVGQEWRHCRVNRICNSIVRKRSEILTIICRAAPAMPTLAAMTKPKRAKRLLTSWTGTARLMLTGKRGATPNKNCADRSIRAVTCRRSADVTPRKLPS